MTSLLSEEVKREPLLDFKSPFFKLSTASNASNRLQTSPMASPVLSPRRRSKIALLARHKSQWFVAHKFNVSQSTVHYCVAKDSAVRSLPRFLAQLQGAQDPPPHPTAVRTTRRRSKLDLETLQMILDFSTLNPFATNSATLDHLASNGVHMAPSTLRRGRKMLDLKRVKAVVKPFLNAAKKSARLYYALNHQQEEWRKVIFCDEVPLYVDQLFQAYVTRPVQSNKLDEKYIQYAYRSGTPCVMCWGCVWVGGRSPLVRFDTSSSPGPRKGVTAAIYFDQITQGPLFDVWKKVMRNWRGYGRPQIVEDNAPVHVAKAARSRAIEELGMSFLPHPPSSPCLNPIENVWNILKRRLAALRPRPTSQDAIFEAAQRIWDEIPQADIDRLIMGMPRRLEAVIAAEGGYIKY